MKQAPEKFHQNWQFGELQIHFIHTGVAESIFFILPDGTTLLLDCGDHPALTRLEYAVPVVPGPERLAGDWIARYIHRVLPPGTPFLEDRPLIDYMMLSHFHADHCGSAAWQTKKREGTPLPGCYRSGFALAAETLSFKTALDRGAPDYIPPHGFEYPPDTLEHMQRLYAALQKRDGLQVQQFEPGKRDQLRLCHAPEDIEDFQITNIVANGRILCQDGSIRDLYIDDQDPAKSCHENGMSCGFLLRYGEFTFFTAGDFMDSVLNWDGTRSKTEDLLAAELPSADAAKISHHGRFSMSESLVKALRARVWIASIWDQLHIVDQVLERLSDRSLYPGERTIFPTVFTDQRRKEVGDAEFVKDIAPEVGGKGAHIILSVPRGGKKFSVTCLDASDEEMRILGQYEYRSSCK